MKDYIDEDIETNEDPSVIMEFIDKRDEKCKNHVKCHCVCHCGGRTIAKHCFPCCYNCHKCGARHVIR